MTTTIPETIVPDIDAISALGKVLQSKAVPQNGRAFMIPDADGVYRLVTTSRRGVIRDHTGKKIGSIKESK